MSLQVSSISRSTATPASTITTRRVPTSGYFPLHPGSSKDQGLTRFFPTVITGSPDNMLGAIKNLRKAKGQIDEGSVIEGIHVEGPYIGPEDGLPRRSYPRKWVRPPDLDEWARWRDAAEGLIRLVTLSPHWPQALRGISGGARQPME